MNDLGHMQMSIIKLFNLILANKIAMISISTKHHQLENQNNKLMKLHSHNPLISNVEIRTLCIPPNLQTHRSTSYNELYQLKY